MMFNVYLFVIVFCLSLIININCKVASSDEDIQNNYTYSRPTNHLNLTYKQISTLLEQHGYEAIEMPDAPPLALSGDIVYTAAQVLPQLNPPSERGQTNAVVTSKLWMDKQGRAEVFYFYDTKTKANRKLFEEAVQSWSKSTCIKFTQLAAGDCKRKAAHGAICVSNQGNCWSQLGNVFKVTKAYQPMSIGDLCELYAAAHEMGHALGLHHSMNRGDRDKFIHVNYENFEVKYDAKAKLEPSLRKLWAQGGKCNMDQGYQSSTPLPYDYRSVMQYGEADFGDTDFRMIFVSRDPRYQYMFDYTRSGGYLQSHYDLLLINMIYKCSHKWAAACQSPPKCTNHGYLQHNCKCACPAGFKGSRCETKSGSLFPPLDRAKALIDDHRPGQYNFKKRGMHTDNNNYPLKRFIYYQYATLYMRGSNKDRTVSVRVFEPGEVSQSYSMKAFKLTGLIDKLEKRDCEYGMRFNWGDFDRGRVRTECISTFINNEPKSNALILRARTNVVGIVIIGKLGEAFPYAEFSKWMIEELQFRVWFLTRPQSMLKVLQSKGGPKVVFGATTEESVVGNGSLAAAKALVVSAGKLAAGLGISLLLVTLVVAGALLYRWNTKRKGAPPSLRDTMFGSPSESGSSSSDGD